MTTTSTNFLPGPSLPSPAAFADVERARRELLDGAVAVAVTVVSAVMPLVSRWAGKELIDAIRCLADAMSPLTGMYRPAAAEWRTSCRGADGDRRCGRCALCRWESEIERDAFCAPWRERAPERRQNRARWASRRSALDAYQAWREDPPGAASAVGGVLDRLRRGVVTTAAEASAHRGPDRRMNRAEDMAEVERSLEWATGGDATAQRLLMLCEVGVRQRTGATVRLVRPSAEAVAERHGLEAAEVRSVVRRCRHRLQVDLVARGLMAPPRDASARLLEAVEARRAELERRRQR